MNLKRAKKNDLLKRWIALGLVHLKDGDDEQGGGGGGTDDDAAKKAAEEEAARKAAEDEAARKKAEEEGKNKPSDKEAELLRDVMKHKQKAKETADQLSKVNEELNKLKGTLGELSAEDVAKLVQERKDAERTAAEKRGEYDRIVEQMKTENGKLLTEKDTAIKGLQEQNQALVQQIEELTVGREFSDSEFVRQQSALPPRIARKEFGAHFETVDGVIVAYDKPRGVEGRTPLVDASGNPKPFNEAIKQLFEGHPDAKSLIRANVKPGANSKTVETPGKGTESKDMSSTDKISAGLKAMGK